MKIFRILKTNIKDSFKGVFRNFSLSLASISCITITLILVGFSIILTENVNNFTKSIEEDMTIVVFLERTVAPERIEEIETTLKAMPNVKKDELILETKEIVKNNMMEESDVFRSVLANYTNETNPLQDSFLVKVEDVNLIGDTAERIKKIENVDIVKYGEGSVEELVKIFDLIKKIMYIVVIALIVITAFLISNTIKTTIENRRREIEIRRLVGASNSFIKRPFFFEGIIIGFLGAIIPVTACCFGYRYLYERLGGKIFTDIIRLVKPINLYYYIILVLVVIGIVVGAFGSYRAVRKYLKI